MLIFTLVVEDECEDRDGDGGGGEEGLHGGDALQLPHLCPVS